MELQDEHRLLDQIRNGKKEAFAELVEPCIAKADHTALAILRSPHLAEEAVQNALIESLRIPRNCRFHD
jgi:RNA polymerase sigma-70 factor (ECF subfamily)